VLALAFGRSVAGRFVPRYSFLALVFERFVAGHFVPGFSFWILDPGRFPRFFIPGLSFLAFLSWTLRLLGIAGTGRLTRPPTAFSPIVSIIHLCGKFFQKTIAYSPLG
jgi:hypothetical protein